jgi:DNA-binding CsgD family transcriptional regulator
MMEGFGSNELVGREQDAALVADSVTGSGGGVLLVAEPGMGKTALARSVVGRLGELVHPVWIYASPALSQIPFGALAPHLGPLAPQESGSVLAAMRSLKATVGQYSADGRPVLLVIDDVHDLDENSAVLAAQLVSSGAARILALGKAGSQPPQEIASLVTDRILQRHVLSPLTDAQVDQLCRTILGAPILRSSSESISRASGGNPVFVLALLAQARRRNALMERNGMWLLTGEPPSPDPRLRDLVAGHLGRHPERVREVLETVALADPLPLQVLLQAAAGADVDTLADEGLIIISEGPQKTVRMSHPLYGQVVRQLVPVGRSARIRERILDLTGDEPFSDDRQLRLLAWSLDCGLPVPDQQLLRAASLANNLFDGRTALRAAAAVKDTRYLHAVQVEIGRAHLNQGDQAEAGLAVAGILDAAADSDVAREAALLEAELRLEAGQPQDVSGIAELWAAAMQRILAADTSGELPADLGPALTGVRLLSLRGMVAQGRYAEAEADLRRLVARADLSPEDELSAKALLGELLIHTARLDEGVKLTGQSAAMLRRHPERLCRHAGLVLRIHALGLIRCGAWQQVPEVLDDYARIGSGNLIHIGGTVGLIAALSELGQGRQEAGLLTLRAAVEGLAVSDRQRLLPLALAVGAYTAALAGEARTAEGYLERYGATGYSAGVQLQQLCRGYVAAAGYRLRADPEALAELRAAAREAGRLGWTSTEIELALLTLRSGDLDALDTLLKVTDNAESDWAAGLNDFARALLAADSFRLRELCSRAGGDGLLMLALDAVQRAELLADDQLACTSLGRELLPALQELALLRRGGGKQPGGGYRPGPGVAREAVSSSAVSPGAVRLTRREREIVHLVAQGRRNAEVARELSLSVRTVEGHVYRAFNKLGISRREDLVPDMFDS